MNNSTKRKNKANTSSRGPGRNKPPSEKNAMVGSSSYEMECSRKQGLVLEGVYCNARFMHVVTSLLGCNVHVVTISGLVYEGVFRTFSHQFDVVLELAHIVDGKSGTKSGPQTLLPTKDEVTDKMIFLMKDIVTITAREVDLDYAAKDSFATDTAISKFNGQVTERELEPWEGATGDSEDIPSLELGENANGWAPEEMFQTNEQQYGVLSTYDNTLAGYTMPLERKNTEEYKQKEAKASKLASEIESSPAYKDRAALENGDEEDKFSAVGRPGGDNNSVGRYVPPQKRKNPQSGKLTRVPGQAPPPQQNSHGIVPTTKSHPPGHSSQQQPQQPQLQTPLAHVMLVSATMHPHVQSHYGPPQQTQRDNMAAAAAATPPGSSAIGTIPTPHANASQLPLPLSVPQSQQQQQLNQQVVKNDMETKFNGEKMGKDDNIADADYLCSNESRDTDVTTLVNDTSASHIGNKIDRTNSNNPIKGRDEQTAEFRKFGTEFKLSEKNKEDIPKNDLGEPKEKLEPEADKLSGGFKSNLNPNAKEFVMKTRSTSNPPAQTPPRPQTPSTVMQQPPPLSIMQQSHLFTMPAQYMLQTPLGVSITGAPPFNPTMQQPPRLRKVQTSMHQQQRHEFSQVAAATGQPLLAPPTMGGPHLAMQYTPQNLNAPPGNQPGIPYPQAMFSVVPRMVNPHLTMVPTSHSGGYDPQHMHSQQVFVSAHPTQLPGPAPPHPGANQLQAAMGGGPPHGNAQSQQGPPLPGQNQGMHTPSPVHQPTHAGGPNQPNAPNAGTPQPMVFQTQPHHAGNQLGQPQLQQGPSSAVSAGVGMPPPPHLQHPGGPHSVNPSGPHGVNQQSVSHSQHPGTQGPPGGPNSGNPYHGAPAPHQAGPHGPQQPPPQGPAMMLMAHPPQQPGMAGHSAHAAYQVQAMQHAGGPPGAPGGPPPHPHILSHSAMQVPVMASNSGTASLPNHNQIHYFQHHASQGPVQPYAHAQ